MLKPDVVFFGENVPRDRVEAAKRHLERADAMLIVGSSLMVYSGFLSKTELNEQQDITICLGTEWIYPGAIAGLYSTCRTQLAGMACCHGSAPQRA